MNSKTQEKNKVDFKGILVNISSNIISGTVIALIGLYVWHKQNDTSQNEKLYEAKISTLTKFTTDCGKMIHYSEFMIRTKLELYQLISSEIDTLNKENIKPDFYDKTMRSQLTIQKDKPILYAEYMKGLEFQSEFQSSLLLTKTLFEPYKEFDSLQVLFTEEAIVQLILKNNNNSTLNIQYLDKESIVNELRNQQLTLFSKISESLFYQIKYPM